MDKKALTLLEIIISVIILSLIVTGLANLFILGKRYILHSRSRISAAQLGKVFLDPLQLNVRQDQWGNNCLSSSSPASGCPTAQTIDNITYTPIYDINDVSGINLRRVKVTINWTED